jgi:hypothetical protein
MPLTPFQREVARGLAAQRNPGSHLAGGAVINRADSSCRYSNDLDIFHDLVEQVATSAAVDAQRLVAAGFNVDWILREPTLVRAAVTRGEDRVRVDWSQDSAFRFFPAVVDPLFGYCLHQADLAVNKILALAGRAEIRDLLDTVYLDATYLGLGALAWAACGKDPGYTPSLLLDLANRHSRFQESDLAGELLVRPIDLRDLKQRWITARERAEALCLQLPEEELGCLYLDKDNNPVTPDPADPGFSSLKRHFGSVRGAWPKISS